MTFEKVRFANGSDIARACEMNFHAAGEKLPYSATGESRGTTVAAGALKPNALGLYNMGANVWEWCSDYLCEYPSDAQFNPYQTDNLLHGPRRAARSGPWAGSARFALAAGRIGWIAMSLATGLTQTMSTLLAPPERTRSGAS